MSRLSLHASGCLSVVLIVLLTGCNAHALTAHMADAASKDIAGHWRISEVVDVAPIAGVDDQGLTKILGRPLVVGSQSIDFEGATCGAPLYTQKQESTTAFFQQYNIATPTNWPARVQQVSVRCDTSLLVGPYILRGTDLYFFWRGMLLRATRSDPPAAR